MARSTVQNGSIVTNGLVAYYDAGNRSSYAGSGMVWYDIYGNQNDITLTNSPTFTNTYNGGINFVSESNQKFTGSSTILLTTESFAADVWYKPNSNAGLLPWIGIISAGDIVGLAGVGRPKTGWGLGFQNPNAINSGFRVCYGACVTGSTINATVYRSDTGFYLSTGNIYNLVINRNTDLARFELYINAVSKSNFSIPNEYSVETSIPIRAAIRDPINTPGTSQANGTYYSIKIYKNKYLSESEVLQNYNSMKGRFNL